MAPPLEKIPIKFIGNITNIPHPPNNKATVLNKKSMVKQQNKENKKIYQMLEAWTLPKNPNTDNCKITEPQNANKIAQITIQI